MEMLPLIGASAVITIGLSIIIGTLLYKRKLRRNKQVNEDRAQLIIKEAELQAENIKKDR
ncbi:MAG TPA: ribonuclease Y, partial [Cytophagales bacterium]|nr:ribonuclease Y [Cytophagales bacterium]